MDKRPVSHESQLLLAGVKVTLVPHGITDLGGRVFVVLDVVAPHSVENYSPDDLRHIAARLKLAADEAEALGRTAQRRQA